MLNGVNDTYNKTGIFSCFPDSNCSQLPILQYHQKPYNITFSVIEEENDSTGKKTEWVNDLYLIWRSDNPTYYILSTIYRWIAFGISLFIMILWIYCWKRQDKKHSAEQIYTLVFLIFAMILQDPLFIFQIFIKGGVFEVIDAVLQAAAESYYMLYPLIILSGFITRSPRVCTFYIPRMVLVVLYGGLRIGVIIFINIESFLVNPTSSLTDFGAFNFFRVASAILFLIWVLWLMYAITRTIVVSKQHPRIIKGRYRVMIGFIIFFELAFHGLMVASVVWASFLTRVVTISLIWIGSFFAVYMGIFFMPCPYDRVTSTSISIAFHAKDGKKKSSKAKAVYILPEEDTDGQRKRNSQENDDFDVEQGFNGDINDRID